MEYWLFAEKKSTRLLFGKGANRDALDSARNTCFLKAELFIPLTHV